VYAQVTTLFSTAQDLLEDFKQFLPESAAQAKQAAAEAAERVAAMAGASQVPQASHRGEQKMPPVGNFAVPASSSKEKKRSRNNAPPPSTQIGSVAESSNRGLGPGPNSKVSMKFLKTIRDALPRRDSRLC
jgi:paired amphipathic helix protein Sin3a